jgi:hypothetical protein
VGLARRLKHKAARELDLAKLRLRHGRTLGEVAREDGPVVLVVSLTEFIYQLKLEAMLAKGFALRGFTPVFLVQPGSKTALRYLRMFGIRRFVSVEDYVDGELEAQAAEETGRLLDACASAADLGALVFRGASVGRYVLSTVSRARHEGTVPLDDPAVRSFVHRTLLVSVRATLAAERLLRDVQPELVLFNERNYAAEAPLSDLALDRGLNVVQFVSAAQDDAYVFKRYTAETRRLHPRSLSDETWERVRAMPWSPSMDAELDEEFGRRYDGSQLLTGRNQEWTQSFDVDAVRAQLGLERRRTTAVVFSHVLWDANMFFGEDLFDDQEQWFVETVRAACENDRADWIVKLHPANVWKRKRDRATGELGDLRAIRDHIGELPPHVKLMRPDHPISTRSLFAVTDVGVTIRGSVGWELPCLGTPVLTAGTGFYSGRGFTIDSATRSEYLGRLSRIETIEPLGPEEIALARRHAYALLLLRPLAFSSFRTVVAPMRKLGHPLDHNVAVRVRSRHDLAAAGDLRALVEWAFAARDLDYLSG